MITFVIDMIRIGLGDSECPLAHKCDGYDLEDNCCSTYRGRTDIGRDRAECYKYFKPTIKSQKQGLISNLAERVTKDFMRIGGLEE